MKAYIFPGQGSQYVGMGKDLYEKFPLAKKMFDTADDILGFKISQIMFEGTEEDLKQTKVTQPAIYIHSVILAKLAQNFAPDMVAGHSLGEFSALAAVNAISFEDGLKLVAKRAMAMQKACETSSGTMAAILALDDDKVDALCKQIQETTNEVVVSANYNCPGQLVISGSVKGIEAACIAMKEAGAKRALVLPVGGAFHSPLMLPAVAELKNSVENTTFQTPICPIYQNVDAKAYTETEKIKSNLVAQLTSPVRWTESVKEMNKNGAQTFIECGPGKVLQGLVKKISPESEALAVEI